MKKLYVLTLFIWLIPLSYSQDLITVIEQQIEKSMELRNELLNQQEKIKFILDKKSVLSGRELDLISEESIERFDQAQSLNTTLANAKDLFQKKNKNPEEIKLLTYYLALALTSMDSYLFAYASFEDHKRLRRMLNESDSAYNKAKNLYRKAVNNYYSFKNRRWLSQTIKIFLAHEKNLDPSPILGLIKNSYTFKYLAHQNFWQKTSSFTQLLEDNITNDFHRRQDFLNHLMRAVIYTGSKVFGNVAGSFQSRHGILFKDKIFIEEMETAMQPLDVLLEKTPFRLTDQFIPGYWGHAAIYIGNEAQLKELGIWDDPIVMKFHKRIKTGKVIVEALRSNVEINSMKHFSDIDDFALLRPKDLTNDEKKKMITKALRQVGKKYDFGFDVESSKTIVCSELHYRIFINVPFQTSKILGRDTISVDQVAQAALRENFFEVKELYLGGKRQDGQISQRFDDLITESPLKTH